MYKATYQLAPRNMRENRTSHRVSVVPAESEMVSWGHSPEVALQDGMVAGGPK